MSRGEKYTDLTVYLNKCNKDCLYLSFDEIERIIGCELPESAYKYPAQWSNSESQSLAFGWLNAGYCTRNVDIPKQTVEFVKDSISCSRAVSEKKESVKRLNTLPISVAIDNISKYFDETVKDKHGRYLSWRHCYNAFMRSRTTINDEVVDNLCLHLAFYLASWGMYRGSSFLLQKDYKVHEPVVKIILNNKYGVLAGINARDLVKEENLDLLDEINENIRKAYYDEQPSFPGAKNNATDTLVTKILLGTLGCVPAYDRYYVQAVKRYGISSGGYNRYSVRDIANYYIENEYEFEKLRAKMNECGTVYPHMKLMDMCMWQAGVDEEIQE